jgi:hypothetical protein
MTKWPPGGGDAVDAFFWWLENDGEALLDTVIAYADCYGPWAHV